MKLLKLGLILDSPFQPKPTLELIKWLEENPHIKVKKFFLNTDINKKNFLSRNIWNIIIYFEKYNNPYKLNIVYLNLIEFL